LIDEDEGVPYRIGDSFYRVSVEEATSRMEDERTGVEGEIARMEEEIQGIRGQLEVLKRKLYGKFGSSINLEK
jgi:prefoldin subunit 4